MFSANSSQVSDDKLFVEDVFSTYLYTGNGSTQTITNGIDLAGKGGLVWRQGRSAGTGGGLSDTARGITSLLNTSNNTAASTGTNFIDSFNSSGFTMNINSFNGGATYASWTFREAPKFFDVVTYTGDGNYSTGALRAISHSLGVQPGVVFIKRTDSTGEWWTAARRTGSTQWFGSTDSGTPFALNRTNAASTYNGTSQVYADATSFYPAWIGAGGSSGTTNDNGATYVAYLFAHDATSDGIIQCGSYTGNGSIDGPDINLGWEPQWLMIKSAGLTSDWQIVDTMRGWTTGNDNPLYANLGNAEETGFNYSRPTATGFKMDGGTGNNYLNASGTQYIYMAIRRGPMRTPTLGTSVFAPITSAASNSVLTTNFPVDMAIAGSRSGGFEKGIVDKLRGIPFSSAGDLKWLQPPSTAAEYSAASPAYYNPNNTSVTTGSYLASSSVVSYLFRRAPGFFDEVCYTGNSSFRTINHNLGVAPELMILKPRNASGYGWLVTSNFTATTLRYGFLNTTGTVGETSYSFLNVLGGAPTATGFTIGNSDGYNTSGVNCVAYLFASCLGVSKVGTYTGNGSSQTINCAFTTGSRFVMIKRTDSTGDWYVWDSARGIVAGNDPYLSLNTTAAEVTTDDTIDTDSSGFIVNQVAATNVNVNAATYIYLAIA